jgi:hypothetical protein
VCIGSMDTNGKKVNEKEGKEARKTDKQSSRSRNVRISPVRKALKQVPNSQRTYPLLTL